MQIYITTGGKVENSTKVLNFTGVQPYECFLKTPSSVERPEIILTVFIPGAKYAWIPDFNRYYFIENITVIHNERYSYLLSVDVLGSYSSEIKLLSYLASRSSAGSAMLPDPLVTHKNDIHVVDTNGTLSGLDQTGCYVLGTVGGGSSSAAGSVSLYLVKPDVLNDLMAELFNPSSGIYGGDLDDDQVKTYFNPFQYIVSCMWVPFSAGTGSDNIKFGFWASHYNAILINPGYELGYNFTGGVTVPKVNGDNFTSFSPEWVRHDLYVPGFGNFPIDPKYSGKTIYINVWMDWATGQANCDLCTGSLTSDYIGRMSGQLGIPIQLSQLSVDVSNLGTTTIGGLDSVVGGWLSDAAAGKKGAVASFILRTLGVAANTASNLPLVGQLVGGGREAMAPTLESCGTNGDRFYIKNNLIPILTSTYFSPDNMTDVQTSFNKPDDKTRQIGNLSGYAVFYPEYPAGIGNASESAAITAFLTGGVYIE